MMLTAYSNVLVRRHTRAPRALQGARRQQRAFSAACAWARRALPARRFWLGCLALAVVAALVIAPLVWFALAQPETFWSRVQDTYIFTGKSEAEGLPALLPNIWKHWSVAPSRITASITRQRKSTSLR